MFRCRYCNKKITSFGHSCAEKEAKGKLWKRQRIRYKNKKSKKPVDPTEDELNLEAENDN